ncbi:MAG TPA: 1-acyl-sn-glycerol-3-phosphate acyltransferase [Thermoanaerobaculia bacterium]
MRDLLTRFFRRLLRLFFRRIEIVGLENVPLDRPVIFAANHPNGLVDPLLILCFAPRAVSLLAKAPLFRYPIIGYFVRALDSIPVYRKQDKTTGSNQETFARARDVLHRGGSIAIFPEGTTHSDPRLRELKTGVSRIALGAQMESIAIVPTGIYYTAKQTFRSETLVCFGPSIEVKPAAIGEDGDPAADAVLALTAEIEKELTGLTLQADSHAALELIGRAERIFSAGAPQALASELDLRRRFVDGYHYLRERDPERLEHLASAVRQFESELGGARLDPEKLAARVEPIAVVRVLLLFPLALIGAAIHYPTYRLVGALSSRFSAGADEMTATIKFIAALAFYPLTWLAIALLIGGIPGLILIIVLPLLGYVALQVFEELDEVIGGARALVRRRTRERLVAHRQLIRDQILAVADTISR